MQSPLEVVRRLLVVEMTMVKSMMRVLVSEGHSRKRERERGEKVHGGSKNREGD
jgi:hypothetical protein